MTSTCDNFLWEGHSSELNAHLSAYQETPPNAEGIFDVTVFVTAYSLDSAKVVYEDSISITISQSDIQILIAADTLTEMLAECYLTAIQARKNLPSITEESLREQ